MKKLQPILYAAIGGVLAMALFGPNIAIGAGTPANKAVASGGKVRVVAPGANVKLLEATLKTSSPEDLILNVSLECSILTQLLTNNDNPTSTARGSVVVWVEIDGKIVPINDVSSPGDHTPGIGDDTDKVTFCDREYSRTVADGEDPADGIDETSDYIKTKSAHSFQWLSLNLGHGLHTITVRGTLETSATDSAVADAYVGNRTLIVEPTKLANNATV